MVPKWDLRWVLMKVTMLGSMCRTYHRYPHKCHCGSLSRRYTCVRCHMVGNVVHRSPLTIRDRLGCRRRMHRW